MTFFTTIMPNEKLLTGNEKYPVKILSHFISKSVTKEKLEGLPLC